jgi:hypothetical protein
MSRAISEAQPLVLDCAIKGQWLGRGLTAERPGGSHP